MKTNNDSPGRYTFVEGERVRTNQGTGFVVSPPKYLNTVDGCYVQLDGHEEEEASLFTCSTDVVSIE